PGRGGDRVAVRHAVRPRAGPVPRLGDGRGDGRRGLHVLRRPVRAARGDRRAGCGGRRDRRPAPRPPGGSAGRARGHRHRLTAPGPPARHRPTSGEAGGGTARCLQPTRTGQPAPPPPRGGAGAPGRYQLLPPPPPAPPPTEPPPKLPPPRPPPLDEGGVAVDDVEATSTGAMWT